MSVNGPRDARSTQGTSRGVHPWESPLWKAREVTHPRACLPALPFPDLMTMKQSLLSLLLTSPNRIPCVGGTLFYKVWLCVRERRSSALWQNRKQRIKEGWREGGQAGRSRLELQAHWPIIRNRRFLTVLQSFLKSCSLSEIKYHTIGFY